MVQVKKVFQIFKRDAKRLLKNPVALVITIGICIIPSLYAWYNIVANWDPYGNTQGVRVAIANNDEGVENDLVGDLDAGAQTVEKLKENDQLGWVFTSSEKAKEGVESGEYYAAIVIPKDFSADLISMLTGEFDQPQLLYYVNEKKNAIAPKVTDTGAQTIEEQINETFVSTVSETLVEQMQAATVQIDEHGDGAQSGLMRGVKQAATALGSVRSALGGTTGTIETTKSAVDSAKKTLSALSDQVPALTTALQEGDQLLATARASSRAFNTSLNTALTNGMVQLGTASSKANTAIGQAAGTITGAAGKVDGALADVQMVIDDVSQILSDIKDITGVGDTSVIIGALESQLGQLQSVKTALQTQSDDVKNSASAVAGASSALNDAAQQGIASVSGAQQEFAQNVMPQLSSGMDSFSAVAGDLTGVVAGLQPTLKQASGLLDQLNATLDQAKAAVDQTDASLEKLQQTLDDTVTDVAALRSTEALDKLTSILDVDAQDMADFMSSPVTLTTKAVYPVANYGSGVAPFYTNLALWVGGFVLIAIIKLEVDPEGLGAFTAKEAYFGRWLLLVVLGAAQALIVCAGDLMLGIQCVQPALFMLAGVLISFVYVNIIYALGITLKHIGKAIAVILVIVQIPGSSGMYPIEMMPAFYQGLHPLLPFTYGINAMRETIGGMYGMDYLFNLLALGVFLLVALGIGVVLRPMLLNLNMLFDRQLATTGVMICETDDRPRERYSLRVAMRALLDTQSYRRDLLKRAERFVQRYPKLIKGGFVLVFGLPVVLFVLTATLDLSIDGKIVMLVLWIVSIIIADAYMIVVEYFRESMRIQLRVAELSDEGMRREISEHVTLSPLAARAAGMVLPGERKGDASASRPDRDPGACGDGSRETEELEMKGGDR